MYILQIIFSKKIGYKKNQLKKGERRDGYDKDFFRLILYKYKYNIIYWIILNKKPKRNIVGKQRYSQNKNKSYEKVNKLNCNDRFLIQFLVTFRYQNCYKESVQVV